MVIKDNFNLSLESRLIWMSIRKFFVSYLIDSGVNPASVARLVGHSDIQTTLQSYTGAIKETKDTPVHLLSEIAS